MNLVALCPCRNEAWIIGFSLRAVLQWADSAIILNHASIDATAETVASVALEYPGRVVLLNEQRLEWDEADYRQRLLNHGRKLGGTHFAIVDADEAVTANLVPRMHGLATELQPGQCLRLPWLNCWRSLDFYRDDPTPFGSGTAPMLFADAAGLRYEGQADGYQLHARVPKDAVLVGSCDRKYGGLLHFQHANFERVEQKQAWYAWEEMRRWGRVRANYAAALDESGMKLSPVPKEWWPEGRERIDLAAEWMDRT